MTFSDKSRYDMNFQQVTHKGIYAMNYIEKFQNLHVFPISVGISYLENQLMHKFLDNFRQCGKYYA